MTEYTIIADYVKELWNIHRDHYYTILYVIYARMIPKLVHAQCITLWWWMQRRPPLQRLLVAKGEGLVLGVLLLVLLKGSFLRKLQSSRSRRTKPVISRGNYFCEPRA